MLGSMVLSLELDDSKYTQGLTRAEYQAAQTARIAAAEARRIENTSNQAALIAEAVAKRIEIASAQAARIAEAEARRIALASAQAQKAISDVSTQNGISAKQMAWAQRGVGAQFTDIVVSLQGGQKPMTVFLQQGGQLKDMFGGAGNAARGMGTYVAGLISPFTVAAAAAAGLMYAMHSASEESKELHKSLVLNGAPSGASLDQLTGYAEKLGKTFGITQGEASSALGSIVATGAVARENFESFTRIAVNAQSNLGISIDDIGKNLKKLGEKPVDAVVELNKQFNFLDNSTFKQIIAAEKLGDTAKAAALAQTAYMNGHKLASESVTENLGYIQKALSEVVNWAKKAGDAILGVGREMSVAGKIDVLKNQIAGREKQIADRAKSIAENPFGYHAKAEAAGIASRGGNVDTGLADAKAQLAILEVQKEAAEKAADMSADAHKKEKDLIDKTYKAYQESKKEKSGKDPAKSEADKYLAKLKEQAIAVQHLTAEMKLLADIKEGKLGKITEKQKESLLFAAREVDNFKEIEELDKHLKKAREDNTRATNEAREAEDSLIKSMINATPTAKLEEQRIAMQLLARAFEKGDISPDQFNEAASTYLGLNEKLKESKSLAEEFGSAFSSAFEDAILNGSKFSDVLKGLEKDLIKILLRTQITEPFTKAVKGLDIGGMFGNVFSGLTGSGVSPGIAGSSGPLSSFSSFAGGGYTGDGARSGGMDGQGGYLAMLHPRESVVDHAKGQTMGGSSINQSITIDARGADAGVTERIMQAMRQTKAETLAAVQAQANRGGSFARAVGRA